MFCFFFLFYATLCASSSSSSAAAAAGAASCFLADCFLVAVVMVIVNCQSADLVPFYSLPVAEGGGVVCLIVSSFAR